VHESAAAWFERGTSSSSDWPLRRLLAVKGLTTVSVVVPARNEAATISDIIGRMRSDLVDAGLVDELVVMDSDSSDDTADLASAAGATVHATKSVRPELGSYAGKGEALWKAQFVTSGEVLVFIDADLTGWGTHFVTGLLGPLLTSPGTALVKGFYDRVLDDGSSGPVTPQGGRVTELVARPLLNLYWPTLASVVQPLAGEWAIRRAVFERLPVPVGYGVELAVLLDVVSSLGLDAVAQVDLGARAHSHQSVHDLGVMAAEILAVAHRRLGLVDPSDPELWQFDRRARPPWRGRPVPVTERSARVEAG
jgi:glucosyl-3-phosphoglycerate synthase